VRQGLEDAGALLAAQFPVEQCRHGLSIDRLVSRIFHYAVETW
jgi:hypothetical protein